MVLNTFTSFTKSFRLTVSKKKNSVRVTGAGILSLVIGTNKPFENS